MTPKQPYRLTRLVKRALDSIRVLVIAGAAFWPVVVLIVGLGIPSDPEARHTDISAFLSFRINAVENINTASARVNSGELLISGRGDLWLNNTKSQLAWWVSGAIVEILALILLYGVLIMRRLFESLADGETFSEVNAERIGKIGWTVIGWHLAAPLLQYFGGVLILADIGYNVPGFALHPAFELNVAGLLAGLTSLVLAGVLREAVTIHRDQTLTI